jgi:hypothetical protein
MEKKERIRENSVQSQNARQQCCATQNARQQGFATFVSAPAGADLKPTEREATLLSSLWRWEADSAHSGIVLGQPLSY